MLHRLKYIYTMLLLIASLTTLGEPARIDSVCVNSTRLYRVNGVANSTYQWLLTDATGNNVALPNATGSMFTDTDPVSGNPILGNEISIVWANPGLFELQVIQTSEFGCDSIRIGNVQVYDMPYADAGQPAIICPGNSYTNTDAVAMNYGSLLWTGGDGKFDNDTTLHPTYTPGPNDLLAGTIRLHLTAYGLGDALTCTPDTSSMKINILNLTAAIDTTGITCYHADNATVKVVNASGGLGGYKYAINDGTTTTWSANPLFENRGPGTYIIQIADTILQSCITTIDTITFKEPKKLSVDSIVVQKITCLGNDGQIELINPQGGFGSYEFALNNTVWQTSPVFSGLLPDVDYVVWMRDALYNDCKLVLDTIRFDQPAPLAADTAHTNVTCYGGSDGRIIITNPRNGSGTYQYKIDGMDWSAGLVDWESDPLPAGTYTVLIRDYNALSCLDTLGRITIKQPERLWAQVDSTRITCYGYKNGIITFSNPTGGSKNYMYSVDDGLTWSGQTIFDNRGPGKYNVWIGDANTTDKTTNIPDCKVDLGDVWIGEPAQLTAEVDISPITCYNAGDGKIQVTHAQNGTPPYKFMVTGSSWVNAHAFDGLAPGTYVVQMMDANGCIETLDTVTFINPDPLYARIDHFDATCSGGGIIQLSNPQNAVSGKYQFAIDTIPVAVAPLKWQSDSVFNSLQPDTYYVWIRDSLYQSCTLLLNTVVIKAPEPLLARGTATDVTCYGGNNGMIHIKDASGGSGSYEFRAYTSSWSSPWKSDTLITGLYKDTYYLEMRDAKDLNCTAKVDTVLVNQPDPLLATARVLSNVSCWGGSDGSITFDAVSGGSGKWEFSVDGTHWFKNKIDNLPAGDYNKILIRDVNDTTCMVTLNAVTITEPPEIVATLDPNDVTCFNGSDGSIIVSGPQNGTKPYAFSKDGGLHWQTDSVFGGLKADIYFIQIKDALNCTADLGSVTIGQPPQLAATLQALPETVEGANDGVILITNVTGGSGDNYKFSIDSLHWRTTTVFDSLAPREYTVWIWDANTLDCMRPYKIVVPPAGAISFAYQVDSVKCFGGNDGRITFINTTGGTNYDFSIDGGKTWSKDSVFSVGITARDYNLMMRKADDHTTTAGPVVATVGQPKPVGLYVQANPESVSGKGDGSIVITSTWGGSGGYQYKLNNGPWGTTTTFANLTSGVDYTLHIIDKNGCPKDTTVKLPAAGSFTATVSVKNILCNGDKNGSIDFNTPVGGTAPYEYSIRNGAPGTWQDVPSFSNLTAGTYYPVVREKNNPAVSAILSPVLISEPTDINFNIIGGKFDCNTRIWQLQVTVTGGTKPYKKDPSGSYTINAGGSRTFTVIDANDCQKSQNVKMSDPAPVVATAVSEPPVCYGESAVISVTASGGSAPYTVDGKKFVSKIFLFYPADSAYSFVVKDNNGCSAAPVSGRTPKMLDQIVATPKIVNPTCAGQNGSITFDVATGGQLPYKVDGFAFPHTFIRLSGQYTFTVTDIAGCSILVQVTLTDPPVPQIRALKVTQPDCYIAVGSVTITDPAPGTGYTYVMDGNVIRSTGIFDNLAPGSTHRFKIRNAAGCESADTTIIIGPALIVPPVPQSKGPITECEQSPVQTLDANASIIPVAGYVLRWYEASTGGTEITSPTLKKPGTVTYYAEFDNGVCISPSRTPVMLTINPAPPAPIGIDIVECEKKPLQTLYASSSITVQPGLTVTWYDQAKNGKVVANPIWNKIGSVTYYAETSDGTCVSLSRTAVKLEIYPVPGKPLAHIAVFPACYDSTGTIIVDSPKEGTGFSYSVNGGVYQTSATFESLESNTYSIKVRNMATGCESDTTLIHVPAVPPPPSIAVSVVNCICFGDNGQIDFTFTGVPDGTYTITYDGGQFNSVKVAGNKASVTVPAGTYSNLTIVANGCTSVAGVTAVVTQPSVISVSAQITEIDLKTNTKGSIALQVSGGTVGATGYSFVWAPDPASGFTGAATKDISDLGKGTYHVTVTDANGCTKTLTVIMPPPNYPPIAMDDDFSIGCGILSGVSLFADNGHGVDHDPENDQLFFEPGLISQPAHGTITLDAQNPGMFTYVADQGYSGVDTFRYAISDPRGNISNHALVTITVIADFDSDGIPDEFDPDADGDGILNVDEALPGQDWKTADNDGDGHPNWLDIDSDNDGIVDNIEAQNGAGANAVEEPGKPEYRAPSGKDVNHNGIDDAYDPAVGGTRLVPVDTDGDGLPDFLDTDSENDHVPDYIEGNDANHDGKPDVVATGKDSDFDGLDDAYDTVDRCTDPIGNITGSNAPLQDTEGDGTRDWRDTNDDNDPYPTQYEDLNGDGDYSNDDTNHNGIPEYLDPIRDCELFVPEAFSPNGDNIHDYFQVYCIEDYPNARMYIFDKYGNKLFQKEHYGNIQFWGSYENAWWDGKTTNRSVLTNNGKVIPGTYFYVLQLGNGEVKKSFVFVSY